MTGKGSSTNQRKKMRFFGFNEEKMGVLKDVSKEAEGANQMRQLRAEFTAQTEVGAALLPHSQHLYQL